MKNVMIAATWPLHEFAGFLQIISWIIFPFLAIAVITTVLIHYRQKRKERKLSGYGENASLQHARYTALWKDHETLRNTYADTKQDLQFLENEMKRQDWVIEQLREDLVAKETEIASLQGMLNGHVQPQTQAAPAIIDPQYQISAAGA
jgi:hypothetical protein